MDALTNALNLISVLVQERNRLKTDLDDIIVTNDNARGRLYARIESMEKQLEQGEEERRRLSAALAEAQRQIVAVQASAKAQTPESFDDLIASAEAIADVYGFDPGKKISIIRDLKLARGIGLREAKEAVEAVFLRR
jgi:ribosomal protein L7/L12